jgi:uncharacterized protein (TIGR03083 family)
MSTWDLVVNERNAIIDQLEAALTADDWDRPTLCEGWRVRDVVAHMTFPPKMGAGYLARSMPAMARVRFNLDRFISQEATTQGSAPIADVVARFRSAIPSRATPPGRRPEHILDDLFVHSQDIRRAVDLPWSHDGEILMLVANTVYADKQLGVTKRMDGLRVAANDSSFVAGSGAEIAASTEALILAMCGRTVVLCELEGPGVAILEGRLAASS